jgi:FMN-dependent NADH-azoreductase
MGIKSVEFLRAEGIAISSTQRQVSLDRALRMAASIGT